MPAACDTRLHLDVLPNGFQCGHVLRGVQMRRPRSVHIIPSRQPLIGDRTRQRPRHFILRHPAVVRNCIPATRTVFRRPLWRSRRGSHSLPGGGPQRREADEMKLPCGCGPRECDVLANILTSTRTSPRRGPLSSCCACQVLQISPGQPVRCERGRDPREGAGV